MKFTHVSIVARDTDRLADFYKDVFGCEDRSPRTSMSGEIISRPIGLPDAEVYGAWLVLPGADGPFLEIFQFNVAKDCPHPAVNEVSIRHIAFDVENLEAVVEAVLAAGGSAIGEVSAFEHADKPGSRFLYIYMRDPEGNILDLKQRK